VTGTDGSASYAFLQNSNTITIQNNSPILFDTSSNAVFSGGMTATTAAVTVPSTGTYLISFVIDPVAPTGPSGATSSNIIAADLVIVNPTTSTTVASFPFGVDTPQPPPGNASVAGQVITGIDALFEISLLNTSGVPLSFSGPFSFATLSVVQLE
jgi:hypothetical protein